MDYRPYQGGDYQPLVVKGSKVKIFLLFAGSLMFTYVGVQFLVWSGEVQSDLANLLRTLGIACTAMFGLATVIYLMMLLRRSPLLVVDAQGIDDRSSAIPGGRIMWEDITDIRLIRFSGQKNICIHLADPKAYLARQRGVKRWLMAINFRLSGTPVNITGQSMGMSLDRVYEEMELRRRLWAGQW
ncbi:STM3941 family protein [Paenibacillus piscarius]|uniref:STM3941 family protein n=1 Tax=Paenibacillus piscarius TaxID=1089681 RepID=UPI001EE82D95|nr:STM3941 family protein [Paenibacillus piscarius]